MSKPEIWWAMKDFDPGQVSPEWVCVVTQNWSKARKMLSGYDNVSRADDWRESIRRIPGFHVRPRR